MISWTYKFCKEPLVFYEGQRGSANIFNEHFSKAEFTTSGLKDQITLNRS
jgi:hypothetical protein